MNRMFLIILVAGMAFLFYKLLLVALSKILNKLFKEDIQNRQKFDFKISLATQLAFVSIWFSSISSVSQSYGLSDLDFYIAFCLMGLFCVVWCYFSWDAEHIFVMPRLASTKDRRTKKIVIYLLILIFILFQGYHQTMHAMYPEYEINMLFSVTNYSIVVAAIALDRLLNQIVKKD